MSKHTPGKWEIMQPVDTPDGYARFIRTDRKGAIVECIHDFTVGKDECEANARLIACAPEMLELLKAFARCGARDKYGWIKCAPNNDELDRVYALIARIEEE